MIKTARLTLRRVRPGDPADLHEVMRDPEAMRFWSTPPRPDLDTTASWLDRKLAADPVGSVEFVTEYQGKAVGTAGGGILPVVGHIPHPAYWGLGLAFESVPAFDWIQIFTCAPEAAIALANAFGSTSEFE